MTTADVLEYFGSATKAAAELGITAQAVQAWGDTPPKGRQFEIQVLTKGKLKADK